MDPILQVLLSWQFILFGLAVAAVVFVIRRVVEYFMSFKTDPKTLNFWNELVLPIMPVIVGPVSALLITSFPYPDGLVTKPSRFIFGLVTGLLSGLMYRVFKSLLFQKIQGVAQAVGVPTTTVTTTTVPAVTTSVPTVTTTVAPAGETIPPGEINSRGQV
jgi:Ca2+/Na+ antiporter